MTEYTMTPQLALRIGSAVSAFPEFGIARFTALLIDTVGLPLTLSKIASIETNDLQGKLGNEVDNANLELAIACLRGEQEPESADDLPQPKAYSEGDIPGSVRVACASNNGERLDGYFGSCERFLVYQLSAQECRLIDVRSASDAQPEQDRNDYRAELIQDCDLLYVISIGGPAAAKVVKTGVLPIKHPRETDTWEALIQLQQRIAANPPPWLAKAMGLESGGQTPSQGGANTHFRRRMNCDL